VEDKTVSIEDQPLPAQRTEEQIKADVNAHMHVLVNALGQTLMKKFQLSGNQFNALELELRVALLTEHVQLLSALVIDLSAGKYSDTSVTATMASRVESLIKTLQDSMAAPQLIVANGLPPARTMNGSKHN
jgi:hypothetical protein